MFQNLAVKNYKLFKDFTCENFQLINTFTGDNNTGKSTVLETLSLLSGQSNPALIYNLHTNNRNLTLTDSKNNELFFYNSKEEIVMKGQYDNKSIDLSYHISEDIINGQIEGLICKFQI